MNSCISSESPSQRLESYNRVWSQQFKTDDQETEEIGGIYEQAQRCLTPTRERALWAPLMRKRTVYGHMSWSLFHLQNKASFLQPSDLPIAVRIESACITLGMFMEHKIIFISWYFKDMQYVIVKLWKMHQISFLGGQ